MALKEYPDDNIGFPEENVTLELKSEQYDFTDGIITDFASVSPFSDSDEKSSSITFKTDGVLEENDETITLSYTESAITEMDGTQTKLSFYRNNPKCVLIERTGAVNTAFSIEEGVLHNSVYSTPFGAADISTLARRVSFEERGSLAMIKLDYAVEFRGMTAQRTKMTIKIVKKK